MLNSKYWHGAHFSHGNYSQPEASEDTELANLKKVI